MFPNLPEDMEWMIYHHVFNQVIDDIVSKKQNFDQFYYDETNLHMNLIAYCMKCDKILDEYTYEGTYQWDCHKYEKDFHCCRECMIKYGLMRCNGLECSQVVPMDHGYGIDENDFICWDCQDRQDHEDHEDAMMDDMGYVDTDIEDIEDTDEDPYEEYYIDSP
jgi:hypothetical protein